MCLFTHNDGRGDVYLNFDTKYLVRWGIPGWVLMILLVPYLCIFTEFSIDGIQKGSNNLVAIVAFLTLIEYLLVI